MARTLWKLAVVLLVLFSALKLLWTLQAPAPSVADNGDYSRVIEPAGLAHEEGARIDGSRPVQRMRVVAPRPGAGWSSPVTLAAAARTLGAREGALDIRWMGAVHLLLLAVVFALLGRGLPVAVWVSPLILLGDAAFLPFFNSFYAEGTLFIALVGSVLWLSGDLPESPPRRIAWLAVGVILILAASLTKPLYSLFGLVLVAALTLPGRVSSTKRGRPSFVEVLVLLMASSVGPVWFSIGSGPHFEEVNRYHAVFAGLAVASPDPEAALRDLGVPEEYRGYPRTDVFRARVGAEDPVHEVLRQVSRRSIAAGYLRQPRAAWNAGERVGRALQAATSHTRAIRPGQRRFRPYELRVVDFSFWRAKCLAHGRWVVVGMWLAIVAGAFALSLSRLDRAVHVYLFFGTWIVLQAVGSVLGDGFVSLRQHLVACRFALDWLSLLAMVHVGEWVLGRIRARALASDS